MMDQTGYEDNYFDLVLFEHHDVKLITETYKLY